TSVAVVIESPTATIRVGSGGVVASPGSGATMSPPKVTLRPTTRIAMVRLMAAPPFCAVRKHFTALATRPCKARNARGEDADSNEHNQQYTPTTSPELEHVLLQ